MADTMKTTEEMRAMWPVYLQTLSWADGARDVSCWHAFLRAASCGIDREEALRVVLDLAGGKRAAKRLSQCRRAYEHVRVSPKEGATWRPRTGYERVLAKPVFDAAKLKAFAGDWSAVLADGPADGRLVKAARWLGDRSSVDPATVTTADFLRSVYEVGEKVLLFSDFQSQGQVVFIVEPDGYFVEAAKNDYPDGLEADIAAKLSGPEGVWFLANPVDGAEHPNPRAELNRDGSMKLSRRSMESITSWRYLVLESDEASAGDWLGALVQLPLRIVAIYTSGGKSVHALVRVDAPSKAHWDAVRDSMREALVILGADAAALTAVRLTRLPGCHRSGRWQKLLYLQPKASALRPICALPPKRDGVEDWRRLAASCPGDEDAMSTAEWDALVRRGTEHYGLGELRKEK